MEINSLKPKLIQQDLEHRKSYKDKHGNKISLTETDSTGFGTGRRYMHFSKRADKRLSLK